jgi:class 3 adenylate cyclase/tetratricopeptide (TPR) repeat protein
LICASCGKHNLDEARFCMECGSPLAAGCPNCGFTNLPEAKFCMQCGTQLASGATLGASSATAAPARTAAPLDEPAAERRLVSILFADLVGFTPFAEERDSEDVRDTLTRYFDVAREVIERYGGTVEKFIGDAVMAVWGAPTAHEDDAERAVRAAMELVEAVPALGPGIQARAGVLTGEAAVTLGATNQGMVAGDLVNTASRLQSAAQPGTVLVGEATHRAASAAIAYEEAGEQTLKGKSAPIAAWRALRVVAEIGGRNKSEGLEAPFVGRQEEMRLLKDLFHATGREKRLRVMSVIGPAGIGKSRLAWEFLKYIDGLVESVWWHSGRSPAYGEGISFWALGEMVRERAGLAESDDEQTTRAKVAETVAQWMPDAAEREWIGDALLTLLGVETDTPADQLFGAWRTFFERIAAQGTVVLVFEDMHFADTGLLDFIDHLLDWSRGLPIYVVTLARPDLIERRPSWGAGKRNFHSIYLEPLPQEQMRELLAGLVPGLPDKAVRTIVARADGIPLYAVETVRSLVGEGRLVEEGGVYVPHGDLTELSVPETLTALIAARLDRLEETDRRIVHDAAVLGQSFSLGGLAAISEMPEDELEARLGGLVRRELLQREMDPRSPERGQYAFVQALNREVAYNTLSKKDRKKLHLAAARHFESLGSDEIAGALASHYLAAHANAGEGEEAEALAGQARIALKAAAARAAALGSFDQSGAFLEQALTVATDTTERADLLEQAARALRTASRWEHAEALIRQAIDLRRQAGDRAGEARSIAELAFVVATRFREKEAKDLLERALVDFGDLGDEPALTQLKLNMARLLHFSGQHAKAIEIVDSLLAGAERRDEVAIIAQALMTKSGALAGLGRRREGIGLVRVSKEIAVENGLTDDLLRANVNLGNYLADLDLAAAMETYRETLALARRVGHRSAALQTVGNIGYSAFLSGEWDFALAEMGAVMSDELEPRDAMLLMNNTLIIRASRGESVDEGLRQMEHLDATMSDASVQMFLSDPQGNAAMAKGDLDAAAQAFRGLAESDSMLGAEYLYRTARLMLWLRDVERARVDVAAVRAAGGFGPMIAARIATLNAGVAALEGKPSEALGLYRDALKGWRATHAVWDEALTGIDMAELLDPLEPEVAEAIRSTREILERLGARPYLTRLEAAAGRAKVPAGTVTTASSDTTAKAVAS